MLRKLVGIGTALLLCAGLLTGCTPGSSDRPEIVVGFYPLEFVTRAIAGDLAHITNLTNPGVEPHDLELTVRQTALLSGAELVVYERGLAPALDKAVANNRPGHVLDTTTVVPLRPPVPGEEAANGESMTDGDPHFWQDPTLLARVASAVTRQLVEILPTQAATLRANDHLLQRRLAALDRDYRAGLRTCRTRTVVVSHDAFEYLGRRYDLHIAPISGISPDAEPSARHIALLSNLVRSDHITTIFSEKLASPKLADALATNAGVRTAVLDPIEGLTSSDPHANYLTLMRANLRALQKANQCR